MSRLTERGSFPEATRLAWLENDTDTLESAIKTHVADTRADIKAMRSTLRWQNGIGISILLALIGALAAIAFK